MSALGCVGHLRAGLASPLLLSLQSQDRNSIGRHRGRRAQQAKARAAKKKFNIPISSQGMDAMGELKPLVIDIKALSTGIIALGGVCAPACLPTLCTPASSPLAATALALLCAGAYARGHDHVPRQDQRERHDRRLSTRARAAGRQALLQEGLLYVDRPRPVV